MVGHSLETPVSGAVRDFPLDPSSLSHWGHLPAIHLGARRPRTAPKVLPKDKDGVFVKRRVLSPPTVRTTYVGLTSVSEEYLFSPL